MSLTTPTYSYLLRPAVEHDIHVPYPSGAFITTPTYPDVSRPVVEKDVYVPWPSGEITINTYNSPVVEATIVAPITSGEITVNTYNSPVFIANITQEYGASITSSFFTRPSIDKTIEQSTQRIFIIT